MNTTSLDLSYQVRARIYQAIVTGALVALSAFWIVYLVCP